MRSLKDFANLFWLLNTICNLQQLRIPLRYFLNLVLVCNDNGPRYGRTKTKALLGTVITFSCNLYLLSRNTLKQLLLKFAKLLLKASRAISPLFLKTSINLTSSKWNVVQSEQIQKHLYNNVCNKPILLLDGKKLSKWV